MAIVEQIGRTFTFNEGSQITRRYYIRGVTDEHAAGAALYAYLIDELGAGAYLANKELQGISGAEQVPGGYEAAVTWGMFQRREPLQAGEFSFFFEVGVEPLRVFIPLSTVVYKRPSDPGPTPHIPIIGDQGDGEAPEGVDIFDPTHTEGETHILPANQITPTYKQQIKSCVGHVNSFPFKGHDAGEVLLQGVHGQQRGANDWEVHYRWAVRSNRPAETIDGIPIGPRAGWQYLWPRYQLGLGDNDAPVLTRQIRYLVVNDVFPVSNFSVLGIGT